MNKKDKIINTVDDLKSGYVVKLRNGKLCMVMRVGSFTKALIGPDGWTYLSRYRPDLTHNRFLDGDREAKNFDIMEVYGLINKSIFYDEALCLSTDNRTLLWERQPPVRMTIDEISKRLGYRVEVVDEEGNVHG